MKFLIIIYMECALVNPKLYFRLRKEMVASAVQLVTQVAGSAMAVPMIYKLWDFMATEVNSITAAWMKTTPGRN